MQTFFVVFNKVVMLFFCMAVGYICFKVKIISNEAKVCLSDLLLKVTLPCSVIYALQKPYSNQVLIDCGLVFLFISISCISGLVIGFILCKLLKVDILDKGVFVTSLAMPNMVFMGAPVLNSIYGSDVLILVYFGNIAFILLAFTLGVKYIALGYKENVKMDFMGVLLNPAVLSTIIGMALFVLSISLPPAINDGLNVVGQMTTPLSMIVLGATLAQNDFKLFLSNPKMYFFTFVRLIAMPIMLFFLTRKIITSDIVFGIVVLIPAMPVGTMTAIFATRQNANESLASRIVSVSTLLSILTIPAISLLLEYK